MDFDIKVADGITHLDVSPNPFHMVDFWFLARCFRDWLPFLATITSKSADHSDDKDLGISDDWISDYIAFLTRSSHGVWQPSFSNCFESSSLSPRHGLLRSTPPSIFLTYEILRAYKTLLLGKRIKIRSRNLVAASGRSCLTILFNICTITCAVASYVK